jgi:CRP/FNR family cyclic AMP-dependent transcriptional regulator
MINPSGSFFLSGLQISRDGRLELNTEAVGQFMRRAPQGEEPGEMLFVPEWGREEWSTLLSCTEPSELDAGEVLIQPGGNDRILYFVVSGQLEVATIDRAAVAIGAFMTIPAGSVVGELAFFDGVQRSAKVWAVTRTRLLKLTLADYERYATKNARAATAFLFAMARLLSYRLRNTTARLR